MVEFLGNFISGLPVWLVLGVLAIIAITWPVVYYWWDVLPYKPNRAELGEKKHGKK